MPTVSVAVLPVLEREEVWGTVYNCTHYAHIKMGWDVFVAPPRESWLSMKTGSGGRWCNVKGTSYLSWEVLIAPSLLHIFAQEGNYMHLGSYRQGKIFPVVGRSYSTEWNSTSCSASQTCNILVHIRQLHVLQSSDKVHCSTVSIFVSNFSILKVNCYNLLYSSVHKSASCFNFLISCIAAATCIAIYQYIFLTHTHTQNCCWFT